MLFKNATAYLNGRLQRADVLVEDGVIRQVGSSLPGAGVNLQGAYLVPGFIDIHTHGCIGHDFTDADQAEIRQMCAAYARHGVTGVCATVMTAPPPQMEQAVQRLGQLAGEADTPCRILGIHVEGPFFGPQKKGAHDARYLQSPDPAWFEQLCELSGNQIKIVCIDPTLPGSDAFIRRFSKSLRVSVAHTTADYTQIINAVDVGASHITHLFNAMQGLHHRNPGAVGALAQRPITAELICDGVHIHPAVAQLLFAACPQKMVLISDSVRPAGLADGQYLCGGLPTRVQGGVATLADGTIAGSTSNMHWGVKNLVSWGVPLEQALYSATTLPAKVLGLQNTLGSIAPGLQADLLVLDEDLEMQDVYIRGKKI